MKRILLIVLVVAVVTFVGGFIKSYNKAKQEENLSKQSDQTILTTPKDKALTEEFSKLPSEEGGENTEEFIRKALEK